MKILVTGGTGFVGLHLTKLLRRRGFTVGYTIHETNRLFEGIPYFDVDITRAEEVVRAVEHFDPDAIVHTAALTDADECERSPESAHCVNVEGTKNLVQACEWVGSKMVFVSSSFVFSGEDNPYAEIDPRDPINVYGRTKALAEDVTMASSVESLVLRTDQPYGWPQHWQPHTMVTWLLEELTEQYRVGVFEDWYNAPIFIYDLCRYIASLLEGDCTGTYHVVGSEFVSRYDWALQIASKFGYPCRRIQPRRSSDSGLPAKRPNAELSNRKLVDETRSPPMRISDALEQMVSSAGS